jgi:predicted tellurium resistance membrane protein TerC
MWRELRGRARAAAANGPAGAASAAPRKTLSQAALQIVVSDLSLSSDNVLAVAAAARENPIVLVFGLSLSMGMVGLAAGLTAGFLQRHRWVAYAALVVILGVALDMTVGGVRALL